jgi:Abnormal spindle-like microcephaly-assoc'd, ASPM-SPD-2-Hydin
MRHWSQTKLLGIFAIVLAVADFAVFTGCQGVSSNSPSQVASGSLTISPSTIAVGNVVDGSSGTATATLTASGQSFTISAASTGNSAFTIGGLSLPQTVAAGQSASFTITFSPKANGAQSATLTITSNAQPSSTTALLTGTGAVASAHTVALSWNASTSADISGYNVYRAPYTTSCGTYSKIASLNASTVYTDTSVANGTAYCYASTAVNTSNAESPYSNVVSNVQIPAE